MDQNRNRILFFIIPYKDEIFYSVIARYKIWSGTLDNKKVLRDLYNTTNITAGRLLPANFNSSYDNISKGYGINAEQLIKSNTAYEFYTTFATKDVADNVFRNMISKFIIY